MKVEDLSHEDAKLLMAFLETARDECVGFRWGEVESRFQVCWERMRSPTSPEWQAIAKYVENACYFSDRAGKQ